MAIEAIKFIKSENDNIDYDVSYHHDTLFIRLPFLTNIQALKNITYDKDSRVVTLSMNEGMKSIDKLIADDSVFLFHKTIKSVDSNVGEIQFKINVFNLLNLEFSHYYYEYGQIYILFKIDWTDNND